VTCRDGGNEITRTYAVTEDIARIWAGRQTNPVGEMQAWLEASGCKLDFSDGPALVVRFADGALYEAYYKGGRLHREGGPAYSRRNADGATEEAYWRDNKLHREEGPAIVERKADGSVEENYYQGGKLHRAGGPAIFKRCCDGSTYEEYYRDGRLHREDVQRGGPIHAAPESDGDVLGSLCAAGNRAAPAVVWRKADGTTVERYYRDGKPYNEDGSARGRFETR